jgi:nitrile hydratase accessory protein
LSTRNPESAGKVDLPGLPSIPVDEDGPVFEEPWQAQAFAMVVELVETGQIDWQEWAAALGQQLKDAESAGVPDDGSRYYHHWVAALEQLLNSKQVTQAEQLAQRKSDWAEAYRSTPHGKPVMLGESD